jgi:hypothetical protein
MEDFIDDFEDENSFEDEYDADTEMDEPFAGEPDCDNETDRAEPQEDDLNAIDPIIIGGVFGFGYEEGLRERKRRKRKRFSDDSD